MKLKVVEIHTWEGDKQIRLSRFVLLADGKIEIVGLAPNGVRAAQIIAKQGTLGAQGKALHLDAGLLFLEKLAPNYRGSQLWATPVMEMDEQEALRGERVSDGGHG